MTLLTPAESLAALGREGSRFTEALGSGDLEAPVPGCPSWDLARLGRHIGWIYDNVRRVVEEHLAGMPEREAAPPEDAELARWVSGLHARLLEVLASHRPEESCWTWAGEPTVGFWYRRMADETAVHRFDAQSATGLAVAEPIEAALAADCIDELLLTLMPVAGALRPPVPGRLALRCTDLDSAWTLSPVDGRTVAVRGDGPADALVVGPASTLLLVTLGRLPPSLVQVTGDHALVEAWRAGTTF